MGDVLANTLGLPVIATWYFVVTWHDSVANTLSIQVNNGGVDAVVTTGPPTDEASVFEVGAYGGFQAPMNGRIGPTMFWKSAAGAGGVLTAAQRTALWNGGVPLAYAAFTV